MTAISRARWSLVLAFYRNRATKSVLFHGFSLAICLLDSPMWFHITGLHSFYCCIIFYWRITPLSTLLNGAYFGCSCFLASTNNPGMKIPEDFFGIHVHAFPSGIYFRGELLDYTVCILSTFADYASLFSKEASFFFLIFCKP